MRLILQENFAPSHRHNSFREKKTIGFVNIKKWSLWRKRKWGTGFWNNNPWLMVKCTLKEGRRNK